VNGFPGPRIALSTIAACVGADVEDVLSQLFVLESLGTTMDIDRSGSSIDPRGVLLVERIRSENDVPPAALYYRESSP